MRDSIKNESTSNNEHGSIWSYAAGFVLSLALTVVPYYLVTREIIEPGILLYVILGLALLQMIVQIVFFLHLGRGPKPLYNIVFFFGTAGMIVLVVGASLLIMDNLYRNMSPTELTTRLAQEENIAELSGRPTGACKGNKANHTIVVNDSRIAPSHIDANRCDTLTITNDDATDREFAFGLHTNLVSYGGMDTVSIKGNRYKAITLNETGDFFIHDHDNPTIVSHFTVEP